MNSRILLTNIIVGAVAGGLIGALMPKILKKASMKKTTNGKLKFGVSALIMGIVGLFIFAALAVLAVFYIDEFREDMTRLIFVLFVLFLLFGIPGLACFAEYFKVKGNFDNQYIEFYTPWTGAKKEDWDNLVSVKFNASMFWYTLDFKSGKKIRLSLMLHGIGEV